MQTAEFGDLGSNQTFDDTDANGRFGPVVEVAEQGGEQTFAALLTYGRVAEKQLSAVFLKLTHLNSVELRNGHLTWVRTRRTRS